MIPFASSRGLGQDLATHLQNAQDNEYVEIADVRGAIARDLHGAFAEWEFQADTLTRCKNYLYSLSLNPDPEQGRLTREQYLDYLARVEDKLGLSEQPRAVVFHIKDGREHCHAVWSRVDADEGKAVHLAYDKDKLMMVTREFARDHGLNLPDGYFKDKTERSKSQANLYEMHQQRMSGVSRDERMAQITQAWKSSDNAKAFIGALGELGYILANGKRPYVLVDLNGNTSALPRMIDDKSVRAKDVQAFLAKEFPSEALPTVEQAKEMASRHRQAIKEFETGEQRASEIAKLETCQRERRIEAEKAKASVTLRQRNEKEALAARQLSERQAQKKAYMDEKRAVREKREAHRATGLAAFLGKVTGVELGIKKLHQFQDRKRYAEFAKERAVLAEEQKLDRGLQERRHESQGLVAERQLRNLDKIDARERKSLEQSFERKARVKARGDTSKTISPELELRPRGRKAVPHKAQNRHRHHAQREEIRKEQATPPPKSEDIDLTATFDKAAGVDEERGESGKRGESDQQGRSYQPKSQVRRYSPKRNRGKDRGR